jgi:hypothetical protein
MYTFADWYKTPWDRINVDMLVEETKKLAKEVKTLNKAVRSAALRCVAAWRTTSAHHACAPHLLRVCVCVCHRAHTISWCLTQHCCVYMFARLPAGLRPHTGAQLRGVPPAGRGAQGHAYQPATGAGEEQPRR